METWIGSHGWRWKLQLFFQWSKCCLIMENLNIVTLICFKTPYRAYMYMTFHMDMKAVLLFCHNTTYKGIKTIIWKSMKKMYSTIVRVVSFSGKWGQVHSHPLVPSSDSHEYTCIISMFKRLSFGKCGSWGSFKIWKKKKIDDLECYKAFGSFFKTNMDFNDEIGSSRRKQLGPEEALLKKPLRLGKKMLWCSRASIRRTNVS